VGTGIGGGPGGVGVSWGEDRASVVLLVGSVAGAWLSGGGGPGGSAVILVGSPGVGGIWGSR